MSMGEKIVGIEEIKENNGNVIWRAILAEFLGNLLLNLFACAPIVAERTIVEVALAFGFTIFILVHTLGDVSGGHFNPAVSVAMFATCNIGVIKMLLYIIAQCVGAIAGSSILMLISPDEYDGNYGNTMVHESISVWKAVIYEFFLGFLLILVIFGFCDPDRPQSKYTGPLAIGVSIAVGHLGFIHFTGSSMNPARSLGTAVVAAQFDDHWVYWVGPIAGGVVAGLLYRWVFTQREYSSVPENEPESVADKKRNA